MSDRLNEAIDEAVGFYDGVEDAMPEAFQVLVAVARGLANGERVEPDYEAAAIRLCHWDGIDYGEPYDEWPAVIEDMDGPWEPKAVAVADYLHRASAIVDAAIGDRLLIDPLKEEE